MSTSVPHCAVVGRGRLGTALAAALRAGGVAVEGPLARDQAPADAPGAVPRVVLLCVPDAAIMQAAAALSPAPGLLVGHCSASTTLTPLDGHEALSLHPLMTVAPGAGPETLQGAAAAVAGSTPRALEAARTLARAAGLRPIEVADADRVAYHAAASIASNFVVTLQGAAERLAASAGVDRAALVPLVRRAVDNWAAGGAAQALTGPIARGDEATVAAQRAAVAERAPELVAVFDVLADSTRALAGTRDEAVAA
ncbi:MAG TPA: DUF2520 domain-containing protein [Solirubrobacteraceae bacterium]|nr:DUF2520 domain-containing protein [Solirubrobacteraceae bacterium]